jgi:hypothetical protein
MAASGSREEGLAYLDKLNPSSNADTLSKETKGLVKGLYVGDKLFSNGNHEVRKWMHLLALRAQTYGALHKYPETFFTIEEDWPARHNWDRFDRLVIVNTGHDGAALIEWNRGSMKDAQLECTVHFIGTAASKNAQEFQTKTREWVANSSDAIRLNKVGVVIKADSHSNVEVQEGLDRFSRDTVYDHNDMKPFDHGVDKKCLKLGQIVWTLPSNPATQRRPVGQFLFDPDAIKESLVALKGASK